MTRIAIALGVLRLGIIGTSTVQAQTGVRAKDPALQTAIEARPKAVDMRNAADYGKYSTDNFMLVSTEGQTQNLESRMKALTAITTKPSPPPVIESIRTFGPDTATSIQRNGGASPSLLTLVWVRQGRGGRL